MQNYREAKQVSTNADRSDANELTIYDVFRTPKPHQDWLRSFPMLASFGDRTMVDDAILDDRNIPRLDRDFWQVHTEAVEAAALKQMSDLNIDGIFYEVAFIVDENLSRLNRMGAYFGNFFSEGDPERIEIERDIAHCVKRDLAWMTIEEMIGVAGFFSALKPWYDRGRWPHGWVGAYPVGKVLIT